MTQTYSEDIQDRALVRADAGETVRSIEEVFSNQPVLPASVRPSGLVENVTHGLESYSEADHSRRSLRSQGTVSVHHQLPV